jgi:SOS-response transcriptional repressor LexA
MNKTAKKKVAPGRIRLSDDSLSHAGINKGDWCSIKLGEGVDEGKLCAAFTANSELVIRYFHLEPNGDVRLDTGPDAKVIEVFAPDAVMIFGPVVGVEKGGAP